MSYLGENTHFSFRENFCEPIDKANACASAAADLGRSAASQFQNVAIGCQSDKFKHLLFALCSGIAESGKNVFLCENTDLPSFRYGLSVINADCGIFITGTSKAKFNFFVRSGFPVNSSIMQNIMNSELHEISQIPGKIIPVLSLKELYIDNIKRSINPKNLPVNAGISCGDRQIRVLWQNFFDPVDDNLIFQVSEDGQRVNAYSTEFGFISHEKLTMAYSMALWKSGQAVFLPVNFHYIADQTAKEHGYSLIRFDPDTEIPEEASSQRFLKDPLFMCLNLMENYKEFINLLKELPEFVSIKREIYFSPKALPNVQSISNHNSGKIHVTQSGKNYLSLLIQAHDAEIAAEMFTEWEENFRRLNS